MKAIFTRVMSATNNRPTRIMANDSDGNKIVISADSVEETSTFSQHENGHRAAAYELCKKMGWKGQLIEGEHARGRVFVFAPDAITTALREASRALTELDPLGKKHNTVAIDEGLQILRK